MFALSAAAVATRRASPGLAEGMDVDELISRLQGIRCGSKPTSCPDQLAKALLAAKEQQNG